MRFVPDERVASSVYGLEGIALGSELSDASGEPLASALEDGPLDPKLVLDIAVALANIVSSLHARGVLHRNIHPRSIRLIEGHTPLLSGFDRAISWSANQAHPIGISERPEDLAYRAPEETGRTARAVDVRADLYSLGATLYECATGHRPFEADDLLELVQQILVGRPIDPSELRPGVPQDLSRIIMRLLEKDPEHRYASAVGLAYDLSVAARAMAGGLPFDSGLGTHDFPAALSPGRLVGRDAEVAELRLALEAAGSGATRVVLVSGASGVGKTSLIQQLRPLVTTRGGWFTAGKFDQYRVDATAGITQAFRGLAKLLLAQPQVEWRSMRERVLDALGANAGLLTITPEFAVLLGSVPEVPVVDEARTGARLIATLVNFLRSVTSPQKPGIVFLDDLQWSGAPTISFLEAILEGANVPGLMVIGSCRVADGDSADLIEPFVDRYRDHPLLSRIVLDNLSPQGLRDLLGEVLRLPVDRAAALAEIVDAHTGGNPFDTVEMLNTLRKGGVLAVGSSGWEWNAQAFKGYMGGDGVLSMLKARIEKLPEESRTVLRQIACLGDDARGALVHAALELDAQELAARLGPLLEDGLVAIDDQDRATLRLTHDRVQQAVYGSLDSRLRRSIHLSLARRLANQEQFSDAAANQYLLALDDITDRGECLMVAQAFHAAAGRASTASKHDVTDRMLEGALLLAERSGAAGAKVGDWKIALLADRHVALSALRRFEDADFAFDTIRRSRMPAEEWIDAACAQIHNLASRSRLVDALDLGFDLLRRLGLTLDTSAPVSETLGQWARDFEPGKDARPYTGDAKAAAAARLIKRLAYPAVFKDLRALGCLVTQAEALWIEHGPSPDLAHALGSLAAVAIAVNGDHRTAYEVGRHVVGVGESRGWEPGTSEARYLFAVHASHWFDPLEHTLRNALQARDGMARNGDIENVCYSFRVVSTVMFECQASLGATEREVETGLALAKRLRLEYMIATMGIDRRLVLALTGGTPEGDTAFDELAANAIGRQSGIAAVSLPLHCTQGLVAAIFGDWHEAELQAEAAMRHVESLATYRVALARLLHAVAAAQRLRTDTGAERDEVMRQLNECRDWMAERSAGCPENFLLQLKWIEAEQAWCIGEWRTAGACFDAALSQAEAVSRPCLRGMISERAGLFYMDLGLERSGRQLMMQARDVFRAWGANAKVRHMARTYPFLTADFAETAVQGVSATSETSVAIDALALLRASHALSSETSLDRLESRVKDVMKALTGATGVLLALWDEDVTEWFITGERITVEAAAERGLLPISAFRYAERTREALLVPDASEDDRFARDAYCAASAHCSLLVVPILNKGVVRAILVLANHQVRSAFSSRGLEAVTLIAGQLAVSLENALLYDRLERRVQEQTRELVDVARRAGMAQVASNVLHNVGNVLNSVNVSAHLLLSQVSESRVPRVDDLAHLLRRHASDLPQFFGDANSGGRVPQYLAELGAELANERAAVLGELTRLLGSVDQIKTIVDAQQSLAGARGVLETVDIAELADSAIRIQTLEGAQGLQVQRDYAPVKPCALDKGRVMQILVNLIENARHAMKDRPRDAQLNVQLRQQGKTLSITISDNGCGITPEDIARVFTHGFTTKPQGHGFGLHSSAVAAGEMGGTLTAHSDGPGTGAAFTLRLPIHAVKRAPH